MDYVLFVCSYWFLLVCPGLALSYVSKLDTARPLAAIALSYALFVVGFIIANRLSVSFEGFQYYLALLGIVGVVGLTRLFFSRPAGFVVNYLQPIAVIVTCSLTYQLLIGPFTEIPADIYTHLERYQSAVQQLGRNSLGDSLAWGSLLSQKSGVFYYYIASVNHLFDIDTRKMIGLVDFSNQSLFLIAIFFFSRFIFSGGSNTNLKAYLVVVFVALHMGINVFSFIRYYSLAPTMLALILYFFAILCFLEYLNTNFSKNHKYWRLSLVIALLISAAAVHVQESLFIAVMIGTICLIVTGTHFQASARRDTTLHTTDARVISLLGIIAFFGLHYYSAQYFARAPNAHANLWVLGDKIWILPQITMVNLGKQFIQALTLWGVLVYALFFAHFSRYKSNYFIVAGMLSPLVTILNPFFVDTFLRYYNSTTLWRLCYLIPIHFVAADLSSHYLSTLVSKTSRAAKILSIGILSFLILLLTPFANTWNQIQFSRAPTLGPSDPSLGHAHYTDLLDFLNTLEKPHKVLTDPLTGYMISALTRHNSPRRKFFRNHQFKRFSFTDYSNNPLEKFRGHLLIVNLRQKGRSKIGSLSGHWSSREWQATESYYQAPLLDRLKSKPERFKVLWQNNLVSVYSIN